MISSIIPTKGTGHKIAGNDRRLKERCRSVPTKRARTNTPNYEPHSLPASLFLNQITITISDVFYFLKSFFTLYYVKLIRKTCPEKKGV
jgi:hypothetical protein